MAIKIFLSCENSNQEHINKLIESLKSKNYEFVNESTIGLNDLEQNKKLIDQCDWFMFIITKDSVKQDGHCLRELAYAKTKCVDKILPIMWEKVEEPRMSLQRTQWVAFTSLDEIEDKKKKIEYYNSKISEIDAILSNKISKYTKYDVFISYGHDKYAETLIKRIVEDLNKNKQRSWIDFDYLYGSVDWEFKIQDGIDKSQYVIVFVTPHSMRQPDGYCLNEITYSNSSRDKKNILRINVELAQVPLSIINAPKLDFSDCVDTNGKIIEAKYKQKFKLLIDALNEKGYNALKAKLFQDDKLNQELNPLENDRFIQAKSPFHGRKWLFDKYEQWLNDPVSKVWCIFGGAGIGKSAFITELCKKPNIKAVHFCNFRDRARDRANPKRAIMSLAYQLSTQIEPYKVVLSEKHGLKYNELMQMSVDELFYFLITSPLKEINLDAIPIKNPDTNKFEYKSIKPIVLVIDAIDEATNEDGVQNELVDFISNNFYNTPDWLKLIITSRPEKNIKRFLEDYKHTINIEDDEHYLLDAKEYLDFALRKFTDDLSDEEKDNKVKEILEKSEGNFEYIMRVIRSLEQGSYDIKKSAQFPKSLRGYYKEQFDIRLFHDNTYDTIYRPLLEVVLCSFEPLNNQTIGKILSTTTSDIDKRCQHIEDFFPKENDCVVPSHKSVSDWLLDESESGSYAITKDDAHSKISDYFYKKYKDNELNEYGIKYLVKHCLRSDKINQAIEILTDKNIQDKRIELLGLDSGLKEYLNEIIELSKLNNDKCLNVLKNSLFQDYFAKYRNIFQKFDLYKILNKASCWNIYKVFNLKTCPIETALSLALYSFSINNYSEAVIHCSSARRKAFADETLKQKYQYEIIHLQLLIHLYLGDISNPKMILDSYANKAAAEIDDEPTFKYANECANLYSLFADVLFYSTNSEQASTCYDTALGFIEDIRYSELDNIQTKMLNILEIHISVKMILNELWHVDFEDEDSLPYIEEMINDLKQKCNEYKIFNQDCVALRCCELFYNIQIGNYDFVYKNYDSIKNEVIEPQNIMQLEFFYCLACYLDNQIESINEHISKFNNDFFKKVDLLSLVKICWLDLKLEDCFTFENMIKWFGEKGLGLRFDISGETTKTVFKLGKYIDDYVLALKTNINKYKKGKKNNHDAKINSLKKQIADLKVIIADENNTVKRVREAKEQLDKLEKQLKSIK